MLCRLGVWVPRRAFWVVCVCVGEVMRPQASHGVQVRDCCLGFWVGLRFAGGGWLFVGGACRQGLWPWGGGVRVM